MKTTSIALLVTAACTALSVGADKDAAHKDAAQKQFQVYPKNLARQHVGSNLFIFDSANQTYGPTEAAAAWLDDDVTTGWAALAGKQYYLLALPEPELVSNFAVSAKASDGTISLYAGDEPAAPGAKSWAPLATKVPFDSVNDKKLAQPFTRFAKYILIETDLSNPGPVYSLYLYGEKPASLYTLQPREQAIDTRAIFGQFVNNQTAFNANALYSQGAVSYANATESTLSWQKAIDDNPDTGVAINATTDTAGFVVHYGSTQSISRVALLTDGNAKGKLDFFALKSVPAAKGSATGSAGAVGSNGAAAAPSLEGQTPIVSVVLDGSSPRSSIDFPAVEASDLAVRWTPVAANDTVTVREMESFGSTSLGQYEVSLKPEAILAYDTAGVKYANDGKEMLDPKDPKDPGDPLDPVAAGPQAGSYLPGALGFPPNIANRRLRLLSQ